MAIRGKIEVLFEYSEYRSVICCERSNICEEVEHHLALAGQLNEARVIVLSRNNANTHLNGYFLQKWSPKWGCFVNLDSLNEISGEDRLTVAKFNLETSKEESSQATTSTSSVKYSAKPVRTKAKGSRKVSVKVFMLDKFQKDVPKRDKRKALEADKRKMRKIFVTRNDTPSELKMKISWVFGTNDYKYLECVSSGNKLILSSNQQMNGRDAIERRGAMYLCRSTMEAFGRSSTRDSTSTTPGGISSSSSSEFGETSKPTEPSFTPIQVSSSDSSDFVCLPPPKKCARKFPDDAVIQLSSDDEFYDGVSVKNNDSELSEYRKIREEQDLAYAQLLKEDQQKDRIKQQNLLEEMHRQEEQQQREELRLKLQKKWSEEARNVPDGFKLILKMPDSSKIECSVQWEATGQDLYEIALAYADFSIFSIFTIMPRRQIYHKDCISEVCVSSSVLIVEEDVTALDPLLWNCDDELQVAVSPYPISQQPAVCDDLINEVATIRDCFMMDNLDTHQGLSRPLRREMICEDMLQMYRNDFTKVLEEFPFRVEYVGEKAVDTGGVCRDAFSLFWEKAYLQHFDGERLLIPSVNANTELSTLTLLGSVLSHGYMVCGYLPIRIAFPIIAAILLGPETKISDTILLNSLIDYLSSYEASILREAVNTTDFSASFQDKVLSILSRLGCMEIPKPSNIKELVMKIAKHLFLVKPLGNLFALRSGVPTCYLPYFKNFSVEKLFQLYQALNATPRSVLAVLEEPVGMNSAEDRVFSFLKAFIGNMKQSEVQLFLRFVTGSSVMIAGHIKIMFNNTDGLCRYPISHTCDCSIELPVSYSTYPEFESEFTKILNDEEFSWIMDCV